jgi:integrase
MLRAVCEDIRKARSCSAYWLPPITLHEAPHNTASFLVGAGFNDLELAGMMGHGDLRTTKTIYAHRFEDEQSQDTWRAKMDTYFDQAEGAGRTTTRSSPLRPHAR